MNASSVDLKRTVNLPKTAFPMKANLPTAEPKTLETWEAINLYGRIREARAGRPQFIFHDGPPYANGNIHLGTAFNKIIKDLVIKSKTMAGYDAPYVPGWDCHGLPIEFRVDQELGKRKASMSIAEIRAECRAYAAKFVDIHRSEFKRLGILGRWEDPYLTMSAEYEAVIAQAFVDFLDKGYVYKGLKPVHWCIRDRTALAEAEVEYENRSSPSIYVRFKLVGDAALLDPALAGRDVYALIWTTTPWTIPANVAICFHPKFEYVAVDTPEGATIVAEGLLAQVSRSDGLGWDGARALSRHKTRRRCFPPPVFGSRFRRPSGGTRHVRTRDRRGSYCARTWPGRFRGVPALRHSGLLSCRRGRAHFSSGGRERRASGRTDRQNGLGDQSDRGEAASGAWGAWQRIRPSTTAIRIAGVATTP